MYPNTRDANLLLVAAAVTSLRLVSAAREMRRRSSDRDTDYETACDTDKFARRSRKMRYNMICGKFSVWCQIMKISLSALPNAALHYAESEFIVMNWTADLQIELLIYDL